MRRVLDEHFGYLADRARLEAYQRALAAVVTPASVVLDLGCGTGVLGWLACLAGARRVYAVDSSGMIEVARAIARDNGFADRVVHIRQSSRDLTLPEPADVIVADQMGPIGFDAGMSGDLADAAARLLAPGGHLVPRELGIFMAPAEAADVWQSVDRWSVAVPDLRLDTLRRKAVNTVLLVPPGAEPRLLTDPAAAMTLDLAQTGGPVVRASMAWTIRNGGTLHGLLGWYVATLADGVAVTNGPSPAAARLSRHAVLLPLDPAPELREGDQVLADIIAGIERRFMAWHVSVTRDGAVIVDAGQASLRGELLSSEDFGPRSGDEVPA